MAGPALDRVLQRLHGVKPISAGQGNISGYVARCPVHDDTVQSLQVTERTDLSVGLHCHAGCAKAALLDALGLTYPDLFSGTESDGKQVVAEYDYRDLDGNLLYQAVRFYPKAFSQRRPKPGGGWIHDMVPFKGKHVPYRLNELKGHNEVVIVEGEKDADRLWKLGIAATTNIGGSKKWTAHDTKCLKAAGVTRAFAIADNDESGHQHVAVVAESVKAAQIAVSVLELPGLGPHEDVSDWLSNGGSKDALLQMMSATLYVVPPQHVHTPIVIPPPQSDALPDPTKYGQTHAGAADAFCDRFGHRIRYDHTRGQWFIWDQHRWRPDTDEAICRMALEHVRKWAQEIVTAATFTDRKKWQDFTLRLEQWPQLQAMIRSSCSREQVKVSGLAWDADPWVIGVPNGVVSLQTGLLRDGVQSDWISQQVGCAYDPSAECPRWLQFLDEVFDGNAELIEYVHKAVGYSLTADMREQCFFLAHGSGSNGKSIFLDTLEALMADYSQRASMRLFIGDASEFHIAELQGARMVFASESKPDTRLNEHIIKSLTGGETQQAERKHQQPFKFRPVGKIWLGVNHVPKVLDDSKGFWRRVRLVPFEKTFEGTSDDKQLRHKVAAELPGILVWAVTGAKAWFETGLIPPAKVVEATEDYQTSEDPLVEFIAERCFLDPTGGTTSFSAILAAYNSWADEQKILRGDRLTRRGMGIHLKRRFKTADVEGSRRYAGIKLKAVDQPNDGNLDYGPPDPDAF